MSISQETQYRRNFVAMDSLTIDSAAFKIYRAQISLHPIIVFTLPLLFYTPLFFLFIPKLYYLLLIK